MVVNVAATGSPVQTLFGFIVVGFSRIWVRWILTTMLRFGASVTRGNLGVCYILQYTSSPVFTQPLSQYESRVVCLKKWLHVIELDRVATPFSEEASNCTRKLYFGEMSKCVCTVRFWICPEGIQLLPDLDWRTSGSRLSNGQTACPSWDFFHLVSIHPR